MAGKLKEISISGFSAFFVDAAMGILTVLFNRQIMKYLGSNALAIYGPIITVSTSSNAAPIVWGRLHNPLSPSISVPGTGSASGIPCAMCSIRSLRSAHFGRSSAWLSPTYISIFS